MRLKGIQVEGNTGLREYRFKGLKQLKRLKGIQV